MRYGRRKGAVKKRKFFTAPFQGREKKMQNEQTERKIKLCFVFSVTRRRTKVRREAKFVYSKKRLDIGKIEFYEIFLLYLLSSLFCFFILFISHFSCVLDFFYSPFISYSASATGSVSLREKL